MPGAKPYTVGVTGGIGAGKSMVTKVFSTLGIPTYDADTQAKKLMNSNAELKTAITNLFGAQAYQDDLLNRKFIASRVFTDHSLLDQLNSLVHPAVANDFQDWSLNQKSIYVIKEAALLFEAGSYKTLDKIIVVTAPEALRINRVINRDNRSEQEVRDIIAKQWPQSEKEKLADYVITNDEQTMIIPQVLGIHQELLSKVSG